MRPQPRLRETVAVIGEGITEKRYLMSLLDVVSVRPTPLCPKNTSMKELRITIDDCIRKGFSRIFCLIDMDNKADDGTAATATYRKEYADLKRKYHGKAHKNKTGESSIVTMVESYPSTELFFLYYLRYTTAHCTNEGLKNILNRKFGYEASEKYLSKHSLHDTLTELGGDLSLAIERSQASVAARDPEDPHAVYTELHLIFEALRPVLRRP